MNLNLYSLTFWSDYEFDIGSEQIRHQTIVLVAALDEQEALTLVDNCSETPWHNEPLVTRKLMSCHLVTPLSPDHLGGAHNGQARVLQMWVKRW